MDFHPSEVSGAVLFADHRVLYGCPVGAGIRRWRTAVGDNIFPISPASMPACADHFGRSAEFDDVDDGMFVNPAIALSGGCSFAFMFAHNGGNRQIFSGETSPAAARWYIGAEPEKVVWLGALGKQTIFDWSAEPSILASKSHWVIIDRDGAGNLTTTVDGITQVAGSDADDLDVSRFGDGGDSLTYIGALLITDTVLSGGQRASLELWMS